ncbi:pheromone A receptor-domain-containing protein [Schizophyllum commune]
MRAEFPVFSFLSVCILCVALPFKRVRRDIPSTCLLLWLLAWNVIHAVNAVMWAGNAGVRALTWCDLATKVMLAALMGVAGCALCMLRVLEFLASARNPGPNARRNTVSIEILFCIVIPVTYMLLHFIVQDQRFAIAADIGCVASIHPSSPSLILMWLPPAIECVAAFALSCIAVHHATRLPSTLLDEHLSTRTPISSGLLLRNLCFASTACSLVVIAVLFGVFSPTVVPWGSWAAVHSNMSEAKVIHGSEAQAAEVMWWIAPVVTFLWLFCFVAFGSERREIVESVWACVRGVFSRSQPPPARPESTISFFHATERPSLKTKYSDISCSMKGMFVRAPKPPKPVQAKPPKPARAKSAQTLSMICEDIVGIPFSDRQSSRSASDHQSPRSASTTFVEPCSSLADPCSSLIDPSPVPSSRFSVATSAAGSDTDGPSGWKKIKESLRLPEQRPRAPAIVVPLSISSDSEARDGTQLRSGWDDMLDGGRKSPKWNLKKIVIPSKGAVTNDNKTGVMNEGKHKNGSPTTSSSSYDSDAAFRENTMEYMQSPVARSLGLTSPTRGLTSPTYGSTSPPIVSPPPAYSSPPRRGVLQRPPSCTPPRPPSVPLVPSQRMSAPIDSQSGSDPQQPGPGRKQSDHHDRQHSDPALILLRDPPRSQSIPEDAKSTISSICRAPWPEPPCSPPPVPFGVTMTSSASEMAPMSSGAAPMVLASVPTRSSSMPMDISSVQNSSTAPPPSPVPSTHSRNSSGVFGQAF